MKTIAFYFLPVGAAKPEPAHKPVRSATGRFFGHVRSVTMPDTGLSEATLEASRKAGPGEILLNVVEVE